MKKLLVCLLVAWFFLGQIPKEKFNEMDVNLFMNAVAKAFSVENQCSSEVVAITMEDTIFFFGKCSERKVEL